MKQISFKTVQSNARLTDFEGMKEVVINHRAKTKFIPKFEKKEECNKSLHLFI